jgi:hypothetical protein
MRLKDRIAIVVGAGQSPGEAWATAAPPHSPLRARAPKCSPVARRVEQPAAAKTASKGKQTA